MNVGDTRAYLAHEGSVRRLTDDHTVTGELVRDGALTAAEALGHPHRNVLTRALGVGPDVHLDAACRTVAPGDVILLCSDGLFTLVPDDELETVMLSESTPVERRRRRRVVRSDHVAAPAGWWIRAMRAARAGS